MSVILFPVDRQTADVRRCALQLNRKQGAAADRWWRTECHRLYGRLQVLGLSHGQIQAEVDRFARAVYRELQAGHDERDTAPPPGAA